MREHRIYSPESQEFKTGATLTISEKSTVNKLYSVLRFKAGDEFILFNGKGSEALVKVAEIDGESAVAVVLNIHENTKTARYSITLAQALTKFSKLDDIIKMNTEIGVENFILFESEFSILKVSDVKENKISRLVKIAEEASRQSERATIPHILPTTKFHDLLGNTGVNHPYDLILLLESREGQSLKEATSGLRDGLRVLVIVGPEGGFSPKELDAAAQLQTAGNLIKIVNLSTPILRTETAGIALCGALLV